MVANFVDYSELSHDARRALEKEREKRMESVHEVDEFLQMLESADELVSNANELAIELERQKAENDDLRARLQQMELQLNEMSKFSAVMAKKSSEDDVVKFIRVFVNRSKQKTIKKRALIKEMLLEFTYANGIVLPDDLMAAIYALDDEQPEAKIVIEKAGDVITEGGVKNVKNGTND